MPAGPSKEADCAAGRAARAPPGRRLPGRRRSGELQRPLELRPDRRVQPEGCPDPAAHGGEVGFGAVRAELDFQLVPLRGAGRGDDADVVEAGLCHASSSIHDRRARTAPVCSSKRTWSSAGPAISSALSRAGDGGQSAGMGCASGGSAASISSLRWTPPPPAPMDFIVTRMLPARSRRRQAYPAARKARSAVSRYSSRTGPAGRRGARSFPAGGAPGWRRTSPGRRRRTSPRSRCSWRIVSTRREHPRREKPGRRPFCEDASRKSTRARPPFLQSTRPPPMHAAITVLKSGS